jgi:hypothetical protein
MLSVTCIHIVSTGSHETALFSVLDHAEANTSERCVFSLREVFSALAHGLNNRSWLANLIQIRRLQFFFF